MPTSQEIRVVIIDDDEDDYFIISDYIKQIEGRNFHVDWCNNYEKAMEAIRQKSYDIYFIDYRLGNQTGLDILQAASQQGFDDPIVILTGKGNKDIDIKAMECGATDYLIKSELNAEKLERCIRYSLDRARDLKQLKARENKYRNLFESSKDSVFILNSQFLLKEVNEAFAKLLSLPKTELVNQDFPKYIKNDKARELVLERCKRRENFQDLDLEIENSRGERKTCLLSLSFFNDTNGEETANGILHDISGIKKNEAANLQAHKLAMNERLMRTLAHEIRNPLNNLSLSIEHLSLPIDDVEEKDALIEIMQRNCKRINQIITELLDLTKLPELTFQEHNLQSLIDDSIRNIEDRLNLQKISLVKNYPESPLTISANKIKLVIAFTNILINAIEAMQTGAGQLTVEISETPTQAIICISDNGGGIPEEYIQNLFEPFFTLKKNGIGLGLSASYSIIQSHGAKIEVESKLNVGTTFRIFFNKQKVERPKATTKKQAS